METEHEQLENKLEDVLTVADDNNKMLEQILDHLGLEKKVDEDDETLSDDLLD